MLMETSLHHGVGSFRRDEYMTRLLDTNTDVPDHDVGTLLPLLYQSDHPHDHDPAADVAKNGHAHQAENGAYVAAKKADDRPISSPLPDFVLDRLNRSAPSSGSVGDDSSSALTSITVELRKAAKKTILHAKSKRKINAAVPLHVKEAMLEREFPHVRGNSNNFRNGNDGNNGMESSTRNSASAGTGEQSVTDDSLVSTRAERASLDHLDQLDQGERDGSVGDSSLACNNNHAHVNPEHGIEATHANGKPVDYENCVETLTHTEMLHLRNAMYSYEKQRVMTMMENLSHQMQAFHEVLEENDVLKREAAKARKEKDEKVSELEKTLVDMKLTLAQCQSKEDHTRMDVSRLDLDLKKAHEENQKLREMLDQLDEADNPDAGRTKNRRLTRSLNSAESPDINIRLGGPLQRKNSLLARSWFCKDGINNLLDRSARGDEGKGLCGSFLDITSRAAAPPKFPKGGDPPEEEQKQPWSLKPSSAKRSQSFVEPKKARALKDSEFMHWNSCERSTDDEGGAPPRIAAGTMAPIMRSRSFLHPQEAKRQEAKRWLAPMGTPIGSDVVLPRWERDDNEATGSRATFLSNITDITFEDGDTVATEENKDRGEVGKPSLKSEEELAPPMSDDNNRIPRMDSGESYSTLTFEPAGSQLQKALSLRGVPHLGQQAQKAMTSRMVQNNIEIPQIQEILQGKAQNEMPQMHLRPQVQRAMSERSHGLIEKSQEQEVTGLCEVRDEMPRMQEGHQSPMTISPQKGEAATPQTQKATGPRTASDETPRTPPGGARKGEPPVSPRTPRRGVREETPQMRLAKSLREGPRPGSPQQLQRAASLRGREKGRLSAGDAYLAFC